MSVTSLMASTATSYSLSNVIDTIRSCKHTNDDINDLEKTKTKSGMYRKSQGGLHLEAVGEKLQLWKQLSVCVEVLQSFQTL